MGFPILVKAVMGGGGKGMKLAMTASDLRVRPYPSYSLASPAYNACLYNN